MIISKPFEHFGLQAQELLVWVDMDGRTPGDITYDDFNVDLYINNAYYGDMKDLLNKAGILIPLLDAIDLHKAYAEYEESEK